MSGERESLERRAVSDAAIAREARAELRDVLEHRTVVDIAPGLDPLTRALIVAGRAVGIDPSASRVEGLLRRPEPADAYATAARLRVPVRPVELSGRWWTERGLPLVIVPPEGPAEALVAGRGGYRIVGDREQPDRRVDAELARRLGATAWAVTPRLPDEGSGWRDLLSLALMGGRSDVAAIAFAALALALVGTAVPLATVFVVGQLIPKAQTPALAAPAAALAAIAVAVLACTVVQGLAILRLAGRADAAVQTAVFDRVFHLPVAFFRTRSSGRLAREVLAIDDIRELVSSAVVAGVAAVPLAISSLVLIVVIAPELGAAPVLVVVLGGLFAVQRARASVRAQRTIVTERSRLNGVLLGLLTGVSKLRVAGGEQRMAARWAAGYARQQSAQRRSADANADIAVIFACLAAGATLAAVASARLIGGHVATEEFVGLTAALGQLIAATTLIVPSVSLLLSVGPLYESATPLLSERVEVSEHAADPSVLEGHLELAGITFSYRDDQPPALINVSMHAAPGELVAVVGPSGAGKSTLLRLMLGFEHPVRGSVLYDHRELGSLDAEAVRRQVGVVIQSAQLSTGSILQNIVGVLPFTEEQAWAAAEQAGVAADIRAMPMAMQTIVNEGGATFSGGQRQRLMIARALLRRPRILIFDEATSALDNETQATVTASLAALGATRIVIAHRLSTIQDADRLYVMEAGRIVESGTYQELLDAGGLFTRLARRQLTAL